MSHLTGDSHIHHPAENLNGHGKLYDHNGKQIQCTGVDTTNSLQNKIEQQIEEEIDRKGVSVLAVELGKATRCYADLYHDGTVLISRRDEDEEPSTTERPIASADITVDGFDADDEDEAESLDAIIDIAERKQVDRIEDGAEELVELLKDNQSEQ